MTHIILTGATGYIGGSIATALLEQGHQLTLIQRPSSDLASLGDIAEKVSNIIIHDGSLESLTNPIRACGGDAAIHLATYYRRGLGGDDLDTLIDSNIRFGAHLIEALDRANIKSFINTGSYWQSHPESTLGGPINLYAATKAAFENFVLEAAQNRGFRTISLTLFDVYGKGDKRPKIFNLVKAASKSGDIMNMSPGDQVLSFTNIEDIVNGYLVALDRLLKSPSGSYEKFDLGAIPIKLKDAVGIFNDMLDKPAEIQWGATPYVDGQIMKVKVGDLLPNWHPTVSLTEGLKTLL